MLPVSKFLRARENYHRYALLCPRRETSSIPAKVKEFHRRVRWPSERAQIRGHAHGLSKVRVPVRTFCRQA